MFGKEIDEPAGMVTVPVNVGLARLAFNERSEEVTGVDHCVA
jgi:hypothetical protein